MDAAARIFLEKGIAETSVDEIAAAAEVAKGTFYLHFASKEELLFALQRRWVDSFSARQREAMSHKHADDYRGRLRAWIETGVDGYIDGAKLHDLVFHEFRPEGSAEKHENPIIEELAVFLERGTNASAWSVHRPHLVAVMMFHALHGALDDATHGRSHLGRKKIARALEAFFHRGVGLG